MRYMSPEYQEQAAEAAHEANLDAAQREIDARSAEGEDMSGASIDPVSYAIVLPSGRELADDIDYGAADRAEARVFGVCRGPEYLPDAGF